MNINRVWAMPSRETFKIKPIRELLEDELSYGKWSNSPFKIILDYPIEVVIDPFAGNNSPAGFTNDINPEIETGKTMDALDYLKTFKNNYAYCILLDPPYSITQAKECYAGYGMDKLNIKPTSMKYWAEIKNEMARIINPGGKAICFGWNSMGLGKNRGFEMKRILLVPHGGSKNDTIVTVERKIKGLF